MRKSVLKRVKITKRGKVIRRKMAQSHFKSKESGKKTRLKRKAVAVSTANLRPLQRYAAR